MVKKIGVDIDGTVVDTSVGLWFSYLLSRYKLKEDTKPWTKVPYNISEMFDIPKDCDPFAFWKDHNLYEGLIPIDGSVESLKKLKDEGHEIIFISQAKGWHHKSKYYFIDKWFPFKDGVILTKEKHLVRLDAMVDDTNHVLDSMPENVLTIKFREDTIQPKAKRKHKLATDWKDVYNILTETNEEK